MLINATVHSKPHPVLQQNLGGLCGPWFIPEETLPHGFKATVRFRMEEVYVNGPLDHLPMQRVLSRVLPCDCGADAFCSTVSLLKLAWAKPEDRKGPREQLLAHHVSAVLWWTTCSFSMIPAGAFS